VFGQPGMRVRLSHARSLSLDSPDKGASMQAHKATHRLLKWS